MDVANSYDPNGWFGGPYVTGDFDKLDSEESFGTKIHEAAHLNGGDEYKAYMAEVQAYRDVANYLDPAGSDQNGAKLRVDLSLFFVFLVMLDFYEYVPWRSQKLIRLRPSFHCSWLPSERSFRNFRFCDTQ